MPTAFFAGVFYVVIAQTDHFSMKIKSNFENIAFLISCIIHVFKALTTKASRSNVGSLSAEEEKR